MVIDQADITQAITQAAVQTMAVASCVCRSGARSEPTTAGPKISRLTHTSVIDDENFPW